MNVNDALSVTQVNSYVKSLMDSDDFLCSVAVRGELSNFKRHTSGHLYFTLKDESSELSAVMFRTSAERLTFAPRAGMRVTVYGRISVYEATGKYQIYVSSMTNDGAGALYEQYMRLLERLKGEGLFLQERKRPIPRYPKRVGIVTSPTGAAIRDMINVTGRRFPSADLLLSPALVQGAGAPADLCRALGMLDALGECDVIIIGRGGGSIEDLWAFNDESVVRAVAACNTPIISAVGHETDTTLCDLAADLRAPTPSAAAEQAVPDRYSLLQAIDARADKMDRALRASVDRYAARVALYSRQINALSPQSKLALGKSRLNSCRELLNSAMEQRLKGAQSRLAASTAHLDAVNPLGLIKRGYSITTDGGGALVSSVKKIEVGGRINVRLSDGIIEAKVENTKRQKMR